MWKIGDILYYIYRGDNGSNKKETQDFIIEITNIPVIELDKAEKSNNFWPKFAQKEYTGFCPFAYPHCFIKLFNSKEVDESKTLALVKSSDINAQLYGIDILKCKYLKELRKSYEKINSQD